MEQPFVWDRQRQEGAMRSIRTRRGVNAAFRWICIAVASFSVLALAVLLGAIFILGVRHVDFGFLRSPPSPNPDEAGIMPALGGTIWICTVCALIALPLGVATAVFLEEYQPRRPGWKRVHGFVQLNIANLAGVPSVVYGILGLSAFVQMFDVLGTPQQPSLEWGVRYFDQFLTAGDEVLLVPVRADDPLTRPVDGMAALTPGGRRVRVQVIDDQAPLPSDQELKTRTLRQSAEGGRVSHKAWYYFRLPFGRGVLAGALTLMLVVLPILIIASQEALRAVPRSLRDGSLGMGATAWQTVWKVTLPAATANILTGSIIAMSRAIGEAAPLLMIAGIVFITRPPRHLMDDFTAMPLQIYNWTQRPQREFHELAAGGILVLLAFLLAFNSLAIYLRHKAKKHWA